MKAGYIVASGGQGCITKTNKSDKFVNKFETKSNAKMELYISKVLLQIDAKQMYGVYAEMADVNVKFIDNDFDDFSKRTYIATHHPICKELNDQKASVPVYKLRVPEFISDCENIAGIQQRFAISPSQYVNLFKHLWKGIRLYHRYGVLHRDIKTPNIAFMQHANKQYSLKFFDWGWATHLYNSATDKEQSVNVSKTVQAMQQMTALGGSYTYFKSTGASCPWSYASQLASGLYSNKDLIAYFTKTMPAVAQDLEKRNVVQIVNCLRYNDYFGLALAIFQMMQQLFQLQPDTFQANKEFMQHYDFCQRIVENELAVCTTLRRLEKQPDLIAKRAIVMAQLSKVSETLYLDKYL